MIPTSSSITGGSAGGHLASLAAFTANDPAYQPGFEDVDTSVVACVPFYGAYDLTGRFGGVGADGMGGLIERLVLKTQARRRPGGLRAGLAARPGRAPAPRRSWSSTGPSDSLVPIAEARAFAARLREVVDGPTVFLELPGAQHAFEIFHSVRSEAVVRGVHRFLASVLRSRQGDFVP